MTFLLEILSSSKEFYITKNELIYTCLMLKNYIYYARHNFIMQVYSLIVTERIGFLCETFQRL